MPIYYSITFQLIYKLYHSVHLIKQSTSQALLVSSRKFFFALRDVPSHDNILVNATCRLKHLEQPTLKTQHINGFPNFL